MRRWFYWPLMLGFAIGSAKWVLLYFTHGDPDYLAGAFVYWAILMVIIFFYTRRCNPKDPHDWSV